MQLTRSINTWTLFSSAVAGIVGSGWLLGPLAAARIAGPAAILSWVLGGLLMAVVAATFVILVRALPITGGTVRFFQLSYGHFAGFSFSWIAWLAWLAVSPIETMALVQYSSNYIPSLMTAGANTVLTPLGILVSMGIMTLLTVINNQGLRVYTRINSLILAFKLIIPVITVILLFSTTFHVSNFTHGQGFMPYGIHSVVSALPLAGVIYSFIGFNPAIQLAAEVKDPKRSIPIAIFGALGICIILYSLIQLAFVGALPADSLRTGFARLAFSGDHGPFVGLLAGLGFVWFVKALYFDAAISPFGTAMVQSLATARLTYAMGENGYLPKFVLHTNKHHSPRNAIVLNLLIGFAFFLPFPSWQHMVGFLVSCLVLGYVVGPMSLAILSSTRPEQFGHIRPGYLHVFCLLAFYICNLMIFWSGWDILAKIIILFIIGYIVLMLKVLFGRDSALKSNLQFCRGSWVVVYIIGMGVVSYFSSFGGHNIIGFGVDFIVLALLTILVYGLACYLARLTASEAP